MRTNSSDRYPMKPKNVSVSMILMDTMNSQKFKVGMYLSIQSLAVDLGFKGEAGVLPHLWENSTVLSLLRQSLDCFKITGTQYHLKNSTLT